MTKTRVIDYTKMELGRVTRTFKGRTVGSIARCPKCGKRGERSASIPGADERMTRRPYIHVNHIAEVMSLRVPALGLAGFTNQREACGIEINATNVDDLLTVEERKRYDLWRDAIFAYANQF